MKYIYDIVLNFNERFYDFYEWVDSDNIEYIKKIPIVFVENKVIEDLKYNKVEVDSKFLNDICNKCEIYMDNGIGKIEYACLFCSKDTIIGVEFNYKGISIYRSDLEIDEALDIIEYVKKMKLSLFKYKVLDHSKPIFITRCEMDMINFINRELKNLYFDNNIDKLKYLYYECFNIINDDKLKIVLDLEKHMMKNLNKLFDLLMLSYSNK